MQLVIDTYPQPAVAHYKLTDGSGSVAMDNIGAADGVLSGGAAFDGSNGVEFNGTTSKILVADKTSIQDVFSGINGGEITFKINADSDGENDAGRILDKQNAGSTQGWAIFVSNESGGQCKLNFLQRFSATVGQWQTTNAVIILNQEQTVKIRYKNNNVTSNPEIEVDGSVVAITETSTPVGSAVSDVGVDLYIGDSPNANRSFDGHIKDILFCNQILSTDQETSLDVGSTKTNFIDWRSFTKRDVKTQQVDTLKFKTKKYGSRTWIPAKQEVIIVYDAENSTRIFGGRTIAIGKSIGKSLFVEFDVSCKDWTEDLNDELVAGTYENQTIQQIIDDILPTGFNSDNVDGTITIDRLVFSYQTKSACIKDLADLVNFDWYVDYYKGIHFFAKNAKSAPFGVTDSSSNVIGKSLNISDDTSLIKNRITILGGEYVGNSRTETYVADGEQDVVPLGNKFSEKPTVTIDTGGGPAAIAVGVENLEDFADGPYDALWDFNQKYLRFNIVPGAGDIIATTGTPLIPLAVQQEDAASIQQFGIKEFLIIDKTITDTDTARQRAAAELEAYKDGVVDGEFSTYTDGLRSGQTINVNSSLLGINENYIIQSVTMKMIGPNDVEYKVDLASFKVIGVIEFLQNLLKKQNKQLTLNENATLIKVKSVQEAVNVLEEITLDVEQQVFENVDIAEQIRKDPWGSEVIDHVWGPYFPMDDIFLFPLNSDKEDIGNQKIPTTASAVTYDENNGALMNGSNSYIELMHSSEQLVVNGFTFFAEIIANSAGETLLGRIIDKSTTTSAGGGFRVNMSAMNIQVQVNGGGTITSTGSLITAGVKYKIMVTVTAAGAATIYIDNVSVATGFTSACSGITTTTKTRIGNRAGNTDRTFDGYIKFARMIPYVVSTAQRNAIHDNPNVPLEDDNDEKRALKWDRFQWE